MRFRFEANVDWGKAATLAELENQVVAKVKEVAEVVANIVKVNISSPNPTGKSPSKDGGYPKSRTGKLKDSITSEVVHVKGSYVEGLVGVSASSPADEYAKYLEGTKGHTLRDGTNRPFLERTMAESKHTIISILL